MNETSYAVLMAVGLGALVLAVTALARRLPVPTPILQVAAGLIVGLLPGAAIPEVDPEVIFFVFLPPVLWAAAYYTSLREFRANIRPIGLLAIGLVITTTAAVAIAAHEWMGMPWAVAVALGAIVSPPDAVAAEQIIHRLSVPRRVVVILEGESLVNDASALVLYRTAVAAAVTGYFSLGESVMQFFIDASVGVVVGLAIAWIRITVSRRTTDAIALTLLALIAPFAAWIVAELLHVSAVLACVAGGLYARQHFSTALTPIARTHNLAVWDLVLFVTNALIFVILGVQFGDLVETANRVELIHTGWIALAVSGIVIAVRLVWVPLATVLPRVLSAETRRRDPMPNPKAVGLIAWTSMRGIVSLASALALPRLLSDGRPFPFRSEILIITMGVILVTLVLQGLTLAPLVRWLNFPPEPARHREERHARREGIRHALERLEDLSREPWVPAEELERLRAEYQGRREAALGDGEALHNAEARRRLRTEMLRAQRRAIVRLRDEDAISDEVVHELEKELDIEALRIGAGDVR